MSSVPPLTDYLSGRSWLNCNSKLEVSEAIILMSSLIPLSKRELLPSASEVIKTGHQERKESDSWDARQTQWTYGCPNLQHWGFPGHRAGKGEPGSTQKTLSWRRRAESPARPQQLAFTGQSSGERRAIRRKNSKERPRVCLTHSAE